MAPYTTKASASCLYKSCTFLFEDFDLFTKFFSTPSACKTGSEAPCGYLHLLLRPSNVTSNRFRDGYREHEAG